MTQEDYVSFEIAKLLKEKGFDCPSYCHYRLNNGELCNFNTNCNTNLNQNDYITAPTIQMTMDWLREYHGLWIDIDPLTSYRWIWSIWFMNEPDKKMGETLQSISTYKEACEAAIKYCLEHLI